MKLVFHALQFPNLCFRVFFQIENLVLLIPPHHINGCFQRRPFFLLHQQRAIGAAQQPRGAGDHFKSVSGGLLSGVVNSQQTDTVSVCKRLQFPDNLVVAGIAVRFAAGLPNFLHGVDDDEFGVRVLPHKIGKLFIQTVSNLPSRRCKVEIGCIFHAIHPEHPALDALEIIFEGEIQHSSLMHFVLP